MEKVVPNAKFVGHSSEIIWQSKIKGPLKSKLIEMALENFPKLKIDHSCSPDFRLGNAFQPVCLEFDDATAFAYACTESKSYSTSCNQMYCI